MICFLQLWESDFLQSFLQLNAGEDALNIYQILLRVHSFGNNAEPFYNMSPGWCFNILCPYYSFTCISPINLRLFVLFIYKVKVK